MHTKYKIVCLKCGKSFESRDRRSKFCSHSCSSAFHNSLYKSNTPERYWAQVDMSNGESACWPWIGTRHRDGYGKVGWHGHYRPASRIAYELTYGEILEGLLVCHTCDNPPCCNPAHLFLGTNYENQKDCVSKSRQAFGQRNGMVKYSLETIKKIRELYDTGKRTRLQLHQEFGISKTQIARIVRRESWKHASLS